MTPKVNDFSFAVWSSPLSRHTAEKAARAGASITGLRSHASARGLFDTLASCRRGYIFGMNDYEYTDVDLTEIDLAVMAEDWCHVLALMSSVRDDPERYVAICSHALKGSYVLGARAGFKKATGQPVNVGILDNDYPK